MMGVLNHLSTLLLLSLLPPALSRVGDKLSDVPECTEFFLEGKTPNLPGILDGGTVQNQSRYKLICQKFNKTYSFATLYDMTNRIPVFSAYTFTGPPTDPTGDTTCTGSNQMKTKLVGTKQYRPNQIKTKLVGRKQYRPNQIKTKLVGTKQYRPNQIKTKLVRTKQYRPNQRWMIEPQLEDIDIKEMKTQHKLKVLNNNKDIRVDHQAVDTDYNATIKGMILERGHLFPCSYAPDNDTKRSTFTLTNIVPQERGFNRGRWMQMECNVRKALVSNCKDNNNKIEAYVVTGAVPNNNNNTLNNRVNIPDIMWTAFCCETSEKDKWMAGAHWGENKKKELNTEVLGPHPLTDLYVMLNDRYRVDGVQVFPEKCSNGEIPTELRKDKNKKFCVSQKTKTNLKRNKPDDDGGGVLLFPDLNKRLTVDTPRALPLKDGGDEHDHCVYDDDCVCSSVGVKGYYLPVVFVSVLVMMM
ncbi:uncharacterized protein LOC129844689 [Salvelinus fontinalis]|uniref:uncharacterized protein LOC129844174 n=1 Tax=Salvelinus fontinalis TaxID=8038 RepID=UPI002485B2F3|nr:uncharacterized protein LOC129844174 [Salvelinus fontinalis]XP_055768709.1 uncharacterized protein LOC129844689 [Salvelinus fontinalis]